ncbi:MAG: DUF2383 domain-containing protein [Verrucomicrobiaceae bacterium]|nr:MAG: DUF2383 domain-containing protein [Verrucomicrobiaceae bacterium]
MQSFDSARAKALFDAVMDSVRGFEAVKQGTHTFGLYNYCAHRAISRRSLASLLHRQLLGYGFRIEFDGQLGSSLHRLYLKLKSALAGGKRATVRQLVRDETYLLHVIEVTLASIAVPEDVGATLTELHHCVAESKLELTKLGVSARRQRFMSKVN